MRSGFIVSALVSILVAAFWIGIPSGCANMVPPAGGPRDSIPPSLVKATPGDSTVNFRSDRITFTFDEDIDLRETNAIIFTPTFETTPSVTAKGKTVTVKFADTLDPKTTYVINFGNSIVDFTEGNVLKNFTYTFATGPVLDSLEITGKVLLAENGDIDSTMIVVLHRSFADSAVMNRTPPYVAHLDRNGNFRFHNLPADTFAIYAIGDAGISKRYQNTKVLFAFHNTPVAAGTDSVVLFAYRETAAAPPPSFNLNPLAKNATDRRLRFTQVTTGQQDLLTDYILTFQNRLKTFDSTKIQLATDSVFNRASFHASLDTAGKELRIQTDWKENTAYHLILDKDFAADSAGRQLLKTDTLSFITKRKADYGALVLRIKGISTFKNPVLQFVQNNQVILSVPIKSGIYSQTLFLPGDYTLRVFDDLNNNGKWDPGHFFGGKRQPEIVRTIGQTITIKANWDNEFYRVL